MYNKTVLRRLGEQRVSGYLIPKEARITLGYPESCANDCNDYADWEDMVGISAIIKRSRNKIICLSDLVICNRSLEIIFKIDDLTSCVDNRTAYECEMETLKDKVQ